MITPVSAGARKNIRKLDYVGGGSKKPELTPEQADDALWALLHGYSVDYDDPDFGAELEDWVKEQEKKL